MVIDPFFFIVQKRNQAIVLFYERLPETRTNRKLIVNEPKEMNRILMIHKEKKKGEKKISAHKKCYSCKSRLEFLLDDSEVDIPGR